MRWLRPGKLPLLILALWLGFGSVCQAEPEGLSAPERAKFPGLAKREAKLSELEAACAKSRDDFAKLEEERKALARENERIAVNLAALDKYLKTLIKALWPLRLQDIEARMAGLRTWDEADRRFTWLSKAFEAASLAGGQFASEQAKVMANQARLAVLAEELGASRLAVEGDCQESSRTRSEFEKALGEARKPKSR